MAICFPEPSESGVNMKTTYSVIESPMNIIIHVYLNNFIPVAYLLVDMIVTDEYAI